MNYNNLLRVNKNGIAELENTCIQSLQEEGGYDINSIMTHDFTEFLNNYLINNNSKITKKFITEMNRRYDE